MLTIDGLASIQEYEAWLKNISKPSFDHALRLSIAALAICQTQHQ
jgi:hypothetical protein